MPKDHAVGQEPTMPKDQTPSLNAEAEIRMIESANADNLVRWTRSAAIGDAYAIQKIKDLEAQLAPLRAKI